ncbi:myozenin-1b isoform X2 [Hippocampus comes]|uniref:myozenin-1b isoform X2 n=1 Tax=Hippocampus comes TaxID=109280 RepID=UPI00094F1E6C|nr:PREDICTED: myozenin-1-like isoform X2 [Hippocampus comes]
MSVASGASSNKRKKANKIITDFTNISQNDDESDPEASELDLGTKIKTPKDVMLEELSLLTNKGSKMFRKRQQRVDKFITTNENMNLQNLLMSPPPVPPKPDMPKEEAAQEDEVVDKESEKERRRREYVRTYVSPWERAMKGNQELTATMRTSMPGPGRVQFPQYKSFNRTALPFGGAEKVSQLTVFELPDLGADQDELEPLPSLQADIRSRPSFNRTPIGWVCSEDNTHIHMDLDAIPFDGETDDL